MVATVEHSEHVRETLQPEGFHRAQFRREIMPVAYACCAGLDVHKETVSICISRCEADGKKSRQVRVYGTFTRDLRALVDWLQENGVTPVAMEATGVYG
jgi:hypothetical protein